MVSLKRYGRKANMPIMFVVKNVDLHLKTRKAFTEIHDIRRKKFQIQVHVFNTNFVMIKVVSSKMVKIMLLRSS